ncbi:MAG: hypothetical protein KBS59_00530 [Clostridiales bacterium]|nr:hypothetical protein [Clostridiales bacterium]
MKDNKQYGYFEEGGKKYVITESETPRHWYNYYFNDDYVSFSSQVGFGEGFAQDNLGNRIPVLSNRNVFLSENSKAWSACALPQKYGYTDYSCTHSRGYSEISLTYNGIRSTYRIYVPNTKTLEYWSVSVENLGDTPRDLSVIAYARTEIDGTYRPQGYNLATGNYVKDKNTVFAKWYMPFYSSRNVAAYAYMCGSEDASGFDSRRNAFIGTYGDENHPVAMERFGHCTNSECNSEKVCLAMENTLSLGAKEKKTVHFAVGAALDDISFVRPSDALVESEFSAMCKKYDELLDTAKIETPIAQLANLFNGWLPYAADMGSRWARVRHNGFRDLTSDTECFGAINPKLAYERIKRVISYQYENGYAPRTIIDGAIRDRNFADNTVWISFAVNTIIKELGDASLLNEKVKFNNGAEANVYEHCRRSVEFLWGFTGLYGLVRIWGGDWNDCVNYAGLGGKGVSVWLSIAWCRANDALCQMAGWLGIDDDVKLCKERAKIMRERIEEYGFDKKCGYYIYARTDNDVIMGNDECDEGKIFLIPQLWAVLAGLEHGKEAMEKAEELLEIPLGIRLAYPAYSYPRDYIGSMCEKAPGVQDNGGIYLHPSAWKLAVDSILRRPDLVEAGIKKMLPTDTDYAQKCGEPYAMFNSYFAPETGYREGTPGQSWRTAASSWMMKSIIEYVFGLHPEIEGMRICPCLPLSWKNAKITKVFRGCTYNITFTRGGCDIESIYVNGKKVDTNIIAPVKNGTLDITVNLR